MIMKKLTGEKPMNIWTYKKVLIQAIIKPGIVFLLLGFFAFSVTLPSLAKDGYHSNNNNSVSSSPRSRLDSVKKARQSMLEKIKISNDLSREIMKLKALSKKQFDEAKKMISELRKTELTISGNQLAAIKETLILLKEEKGKVQTQERNLRTIRAGFRDNRKQLQYTKSVEDLDRLIPSQQDMIQQLINHQKVMARLLSVMTMNK